jgi:hypothetical protein
VTIATRAMARRTDPGSEDENATSCGDVAGV